MEAFSAITVGWDVLWLCGRLSIFQPKGPGPEAGNVVSVPSSTLSSCSHTTLLQRSFREPHAGGSGAGHTGKPSSWLDLSAFSIFSSFLNHGLYIR